MPKKFLVGVGNIFAYNKSTSDLLFTSRAMLDTSIEVSISNTDINGGLGNALQLIYFHTPEMSLTLTDTQFNLEMIAANVGSSIVTGDDVWTEETVTLGGGGAGTVVGTPIVTPDETSTIYGWVTQVDGTTTRVTFTGQNFTLGAGSDGEDVCVRYFELDSAARSVTINSNFIPSTVRLVVEAQLASGDTTNVSGASIIGKVQFEIDSAQLSGAQSIEMSSSGVANTPLSARAIASNAVGGCVSGGTYGTIRELVTDANWYDNVIALAYLDDDIALTHPDTEQLILYAIPSIGDAFVPPYADITFLSGTPATATVDVDGLVTTVAAGTTTVNAKITAVPTIETNALITVS